MERKHSEDPTNEPLPIAGDFLCQEFARLQFGQRWAYGLESGGDTPHKGRMSTSHDMSS